MEYNYVYSGDTVIAITRDNSSDVFNFICDENGDYIGFTYGTGIYYYIRNLQNDVVAIVDVNQNVLATYSYDPWGNCTTSGALASTIGDINPIRYRGYFYDSETGLYYLQSRYYDPQTCRFINADEASVVTVSPDSANYDKNLFAYCDNNPVVRADSSGYIWHIVGGAAFGCLFAGITTICSNLFSMKPATEGLATSMFAGAASGALAATGVGIIGMIAGNAAISMAENAINQVVDNNGFNNFDVKDMVKEGVIGGAFGAIGGKGNGSKHLTNLGKQSVKRTFNTITHKGLKAGLKEAGRAFVSYQKNTVKYYNEFSDKLFGDFLTSVVEDITKNILS